MNIETLKDLGDVYLANNSIYIPKDSHNFDFLKCQEWISKGGVVEERFSLEELKNKKIEEINAQRDARLNFNTPQTVSVYSSNEDLANLEFEINEQCLSKWESRLRQLRDLEANGQENPTLPWIAIDKETYWLNASDYASLISHLIDRQNTEYVQARRRKNAVLDLTTSEEVLAYDITQVYE